MVTTCFFCQSMLSDYLEGLLPGTRHEELKRHIEGCKACAQVQKDLQRTLSMARNLCGPRLAPETAMRIAEACQAGSRRWTARGASRVAFAVGFPLLLLASASVFFPSVFPWVTRMTASTDQASFVRYFPLLEGASDIVEEHGNWLHLREPAMRSLWEEGGISPDEFEKSFTGRPSVGEDTK